MADVEWKRGGKKSKTRKIEIGRMLAGEFVGSTPTWTPKERTRNIPIHYNYQIIPMLARIEEKEPEIRLIRGYRSSGIATTGI